MSEPKFTPGPWNIKPRTGEKNCVGGISYSRITILNMPDGQYKPRHVIAQVARGNGRGEANASLIAAAPEMYSIVAELEEMAFSGCASIEDVQNLIQRAMFVAKKARGEK